MADGRARTLGYSALVLAAGLVSLSVTNRSVGRIVDPAAGRYRSPGTVLTTVTTRDGHALLAEAVNRDSKGGLTLTRLGHRSYLPPSELDDRHPLERRRHLLGTDRLGRDVLSRTRLALTNSLQVAVGGGALSLVIGLAIGLVAARAPRWIEEPLSRTTDVLIAIPKLFLVLAVAATATPGKTLLIVLLASITWMPTARIVRAQSRSLAASDFVMAAVAAGVGPFRLATRHLLRHLAPTLAGLFALRVANLILLESSLSFLGAGLPPPLPSLGAMVAEAAAPGARWWTVLPPGIVITTVSLLFFRAADAFAPDGGDRSL